MLDLLGEGQGIADKARKALPQRVVEALDVVGFPCLLRDRFVALRRHDTPVYFILVRVKCGLVLIDLGDRSPQSFGTLAAAIADMKRNNLGSATQVMLSMPFRDTVGQNPIDITEVKSTMVIPESCPACGS